MPRKAIQAALLDEVAPVEATLSPGLVVITLGTAPPSIEIEGTIKGENLEWFATRCLEEVFAQSWGQQNEGGFMAAPGGGTAPSVPREAARRGFNFARKRPAGPCPVCKTHEWVPDRPKGGWKCGNCHPIRP